MADQSNNSGSRSKITVLGPLSAQVVFSTKGLDATFTAKIQYASVEEVVQKAAARTIIALQAAVRGAVDKKLALPFPQGKVFEVNGDGEYKKSAAEQLMDTVLMAKQNPELLAMLKALINGEDQKQQAPVVQEVQEDEQSVEEIAQEDEESEESAASEVDEEEIRSMGTGKLAQLLVEKGIDYKGKTRKQMIDLVLAR